MRLREVAKDAHIHAVLSWESSDRLAVIAFVVVSDTVDSFKKFFARDVELLKEATLVDPSFHPGIEYTPGRIVSAAERANITSPSCVEGAQELRPVMVAALRGQGAK